MPDTYSPPLRNDLSSRIRAVADRAAVERPDYRTIAFDLWALRVEATKEADTLDAQMIDIACSLQERSND